MRRPRRRAPAGLWPLVVLEVLEFDRAVQAALEFAQQDGHTLVIVVADHETGGLVLVGPDGGAGGLPPDDAIPRYQPAADGYPRLIEQDGQAVLSGWAVTWTSGGAHTAADVPISAYAPEERDWRPFTGAQRNADVFFDVAAVLQRR